MGSKSPSHAKRALGPGRAVAGLSVAMVLLSAAVIAIDRDRAVADEVAVSPDIEQFRLDYAVQTQATNPFGAWLRQLGNQGIRVLDLHGTPVDIADTTVTWRNWIGEIGPSKLTFGGGTSQCGVSESCVIFAISGQPITVRGSTCTPRVVSTTTSWATSRLDAGPTHRDSTLGPTGCGGTWNFPVVVVAYNAAFSHSAQELRHIGRHELGHALYLWHPLSEVGCWIEAEDGLAYPLMNGGSGCSFFGLNAYATLNEVSKVRTSNGF